MGRRFRHRDTDWEVAATGTGHGAGFGEKPPPITSWGVLFTSISPAGKGPYFASVSKPDVNLLSESELRDSLDAAIARAVIKALEDPRFEWRTVDGVAQETGLPEDEILRIIEAVPDEVIRSRDPDQRGRALYTTRRHYTQKRNLLEWFRST